MESFRELRMNETGDWWIFPQKNEVKQTVNEKMHVHVVLDVCPFLWQLLWRCWKKLTYDQSLKFWQSQHPHSHIIVIWVLRCLACNYNVAICHTTWLLFVTFPARLSKAKLMKKPAGKGTGHSSKSLPMPFLLRSLLLPLPILPWTSSSCPHSIASAYSTLPLYHTVQHARPLSDLPIYFKRHLKNCTICCVRF